MLVVAPWVRSGYLLLLDWVSGPTQTLTPGVYGLSGSALDAMPFRLGTQVLRTLVGPAATAWLLVLAYFPLAAAGMATAVRGSRWRGLSAALVVVANPVVVDRVRAGHVALLLGMALLPWLLASAVHARRLGKRFAVRPAGWYALAVSLSPHAAWLGAAVLLAVMLLPRPRTVDVVRTAQVLVSGALVYAYALVIWASGTRTLAVTGADLAAYATTPGPGGLSLTALSLHGFWRDWPEQVRDGLPPPVALAVLVVVLVAVVLGLTRLTRLDPDRGAPLAALTAVGLLLGAGVDGPLGGLYRWAFDWLPLFEAMREQQKWVALAVLGYAAGLGVAVEALVLRRGLLPRLAGGALAAVPAVVVGPALLLGLGGTVTTSTYPASWAQAERLMGSGDGLVLFLPWHAYQPFSFTDGRTVATPAEAYFSRRVLVSDAVELPELRTDSTSLRTAYVDRLVADAGGGAFGRLLAPLGVEYVVLSTEREAASYTWVAEQPDLALELSTDDLQVYRVLPQGTGRVVDAVRGDYADAAAWAAAGRLGSEAVLPDTGAGAGRPSGGDAAGALRRDGPTRWVLGPGPPGWVVVPEEWAPGWSAPGAPSEPTLAGTVALRAGAQTTTVSYGPSRYLALGLAVSLGVLVGLVIAGLVEHRRDLAGWRRPSRARTPPR